ncbi:MAG TPA: glycosyltransferase family 4 protein [Acidimicrobiia bacterium]|nr:glycosyltransferase family 4 protein [Acidimicrobiia bacterium]
MTPETHLRIGMIAPISHRFPPDGYGPWERVCHDLTEGLVSLGHEVVAFAPAGSVTSAKLTETVPSSLDRAQTQSLPDPRVWEEFHLAQAISQAVELELDVIHSHLHVHALGFARLIPMPLVTTLHGAAWNRSHHLLLRAFREQPFVSLSESERRFLPELNYVATVSNGIRLDDFPLGGGGEGLVFVGRMAPEKAPELAIEVARRAGTGLTLAGGIEEKHREFFDGKVRPHLSDRSIEYVGALSRSEVARLVGESGGLVMPLRWDEPFGLVVVESLAVGTPVIAWRRGAMPELIRDGSTGFLVDDVDGAAAAAADELSAIDRGRCRREAELRFGHGTMAEGYVDAYRRAIGQAISARTSSREAVATRTPMSEKP